MVKVQFSKQNQLILPEPLGRALGLSEGDRVEVRREDNVLCVRRRDPAQMPGPLTDFGPHRLFITANWLGRRG